MTPLESRHALGMRIDKTSYGDAAGLVAGWARKSEARYVCVANVHMAMEAHDSEEFRRVVNAADLVTPDGVPLVWCLRLMGVRGASRVYGPDLTLAVLAEAEREHLPVGFYGGSEAVLQMLRKSLGERFPGLQVGYCWAPPFRPLDAQEDRRITEEIRASGVRILFVGIGCPKQERWMAEHRGRFDAVMLGVGAAFDFLAGVKPQARPWMQALGLEWLFRLMTEPRRLWRRYLKQNPRFVAYLTMQLLGIRQFPREVSGG
jgi:N-acetylglucosaminyldiphosphoundecaprenol N-acetyl-beta-D-mannosaminyltransferase